MSPTVVPSGVARLGHTGARVPAIRGRAPATRGHAAPSVRVRNRIIGGEVERRVKVR